MTNKTKLKSHVDTMKNESLAELKVNTHNKQ